MTLTKKPAGIRAMGTVALAAAALLFGFGLVGCGGDDEPDTKLAPGGLPESKGVNALSGKTYFDSWNKIEFAATADGAALGSFSIFEVKEDSNNDLVLDNGKYTYDTVKTGYYSWNADTKTVVISPEKAASRDKSAGMYGPLQTKTGYKETVKQYAQAELAGYKEKGKEAEFYTELKSYGFSSIDEYVDYLVASAFKNVTYDYAFSADPKVLFLTEALPANNGLNELAGQTYYGTKWDAATLKQVKDSTKTYVFTADGCTYTTSSYSQAYDYTYDSINKKVYLREPITGRDSAYATQSSNTTDSGYFASVDDYNAAQVNKQYSDSVRSCTYNITEKTLQQE